MIFIFQKDLEDEEFIARLAYSSNIFKAFNHLNLLVQDENFPVDFISKLENQDQWKKNVERSAMERLCFCQEYIELRNDALAFKADNSRPILTT